MCSELLQYLIPMLTYAGPVIAGVVLGAVAAGPVGAIGGGLVGIGLSWLIARRRA